jgi:SAM-dependent methyltransferase
MDRDVERFNRRAGDYEREWLQPRFFTPVRRATLDVAASLRPDPATVLDVGCGTGALLRLAAERLPGALRVGTDPAARMIACADAGGAELVQAAAERIPFADGSFDLVLSTLSLHHWADRAQGVREIARVLAPGGVVVLADRWLPHRVDGMVAAAGLDVGGRRPVFAVGPMTVVTAL